MKKEAVATFVENKKKSDVSFNSDDVVFSIPYSKIVEAEDFVRAEELEYCYLGYRQLGWHIQATDKGLNPVVKISADGLSPETTEAYIVNITQV